VYGANFVVRNSVLTSVVPSGSSAISYNLRQYALPALAASINTVPGYTATVNAGAQTQGFTTAVAPAATLSGFSAYREPPDLGLGRNMVVNGGFLSGSYGWTLHANASAIVDLTSPTGYALRLIATAVGQYNSVDFPVEAGKAYSVAMQSRQDGIVRTDLDEVWLDASGAIISAATIITGPSGTGWTESSATNRTAPGNARTLRIRFYASAAGIVHVTAIRVMQQTTAPAAWTAAHQQYVSRGLSIYEAATNLLTNGDIETALAGTVNAFVDPFADLNAWTLESGLTFTVAANVVSNAAGSNRMSFGHSEWWDIAAGTQLRFKWVTGGGAYLFLRYTDASNYVFLYADGTNVSIQKRVAGIDSNVSGNIAAALVSGNWYWFNPVITGSSYSATLVNDNAGANTGTTVATITAQTIADAVHATGRMAVQMDGGAGTQIGGAFANVCRVVIAAPPGWTPTVSTGVPAFCVSKTTKFGGINALATYNKHAGASGYWTQSSAVAAGTYTASGRIKTSAAIGGTGAYIDIPFVGSPSTPITGTKDWQPSSTTYTTALGTTGKMNFWFAGAGNAWFDQAWFAQQSYDTGNSDLSGLAYVPTGARTASDVRLPIPGGFDVTNFAVVGVYRPDYASTFASAQRELFWVQTGVDTYRMVIDTGTFFMQKNRAGVLTSVTVAPAFAAGDTVVWAMRKNAAGMAIWVSVNGAAAVTATNVTPAGLLDITGPATRFDLGHNGGITQQDGTSGVVRVLAAGATDAQIVALVANLYQAQDETYELAAWRFEGAAVLEDFNSNTLALEVGGTYATDPAIELTAGGAYTGNVIVTDSLGNILTWNGTLALNDVLKLESDTMRVRKNGTLSMAGVQAGSKWPRFRGGGLRDSIVVTGIAAANIKALKASYRLRWI
jgi:hypothetical protein